MARKSKKSPLLNPDDISLFRDAVVEARYNVTKKDVRGAIPLDEFNCHHARAIKRSFSVTQVSVRRNRILVSYDNKKWTVYSINTATYLETLVFDRGGSPKYGEYCLLVPKRYKKGPSLGGTRPTPSIDPRRLRRLGLK